MDKKTEKARVRKKIENDRHKKIQTYEHRQRQIEREWFTEKKQIEKQRKR